MWAYNKLFVIIASVIFLGSIELSEDAFAVLLNSNSACTTGLGGTITSANECTVDNSISISDLNVQSVWTLEVGDGIGAPGSTIITITTSGSSSLDNSGTLNVRSDGSIVHTGTGIRDFDNNPGGMVTVEGSIVLGRHYDNERASTTVLECGGTITVGATSDFNNKWNSADGPSTFTQRGLLNGAMSSPPAASLPPNLDLHTNSIYIPDSASCAAGVPDVSIDDVTLAEGTGGGPTVFSFTVTRSNNVGAISVDYDTSDGSATTADTDYTGIGAPLTLNFADGGALTTQATVNVIHDNTVELDENFFVDLTNCVGCNISDNQGEGTITNDDSAILSIGDHSEAETNSGNYQFLFPLSLTNPVDVSITVEGTTSDGSATTADNDYVGGTGSVGFGAGTTSDEFNITVNGDVDVEPDENFFLDIIILTAGGRDVSLGDSQGEGTILNDDTVASADLSITKSDDIDPIIAGNTLTYTVTVDNAGPDTANNVVVTDTLPAGVTFVSTTGCAEDPGGVPTCSLGNIVSGGSAQYTVEVTVDISTTGIIVNNVSVTADETDPDNSNNSIGQGTTVNSGGGPATETLYGLGQSDDRLFVIDPSDASTISSVTITLAGGTVNGGLGAAIDPTTGDLYAILKASGLGLSGRALVTIDPSTGVATLIGDTGDSYAGLEFANDGTLYGLTGDGASDPARINILSKTDASVVSFVCDLVNTSDDGESFVNVNEVWYHFSAHSTGGSEPNDYVIEIIDINNNCAFTNIPESGDFDEELIAAAYCPESDRIFLGQDHDDPNDLMLMSPAGVGTFIGEVGDDYQLAGLACTGDAVTPSADLELTKDVDVASPGFGDTITFTVTVTNNGPISATGVEVTDVIPSEITLGSVTPSIGSYLGSIWTIGNLANGASETLTIVGDVNAPVSFTNTAEVTAVNENDPDSTPNNNILAEDDQDSAVVTPSILYGSDINNNLFLVDVNSGAGTLVGTFVPTGMDYSTEIECMPDASACYAQQRNGGFAIEPFDLTTGTLLGPVVPNGAAFNGLEYVGPTLYGTSILGGGGASPSTFSTLDPITGISIPIGLTGIGAISGIAYDSTGGIMYGIQGGPGPADFYTIDIGTGIATVVGNTGIVGAGSLQFGPDGNLYAGGNSNDGGNLYQINTSTGASTLIGNPGFGSLTGLTLVGTSAPPVPGPSAASANTGDSGVHADPTLEGKYVNPSFCFNQVCPYVEDRATFTHLDLQTVDSGSTHTISVTAYCPSGVEKCNYIAVGASPPGTDMRDSVWKLILSKNLDGTWTLTKVDDFGALGDVTATAQKVNGNLHVQATFTIEFLLSTILGSPPVGEDNPPGNQVINVELRDSRGGYSTYQFNEGFEVNDIYAYPEIDTSFEAPLVYEKLCLNEDEKKRYTCAFDKVKDWTIKQAEEKLKEVYVKHGN